MKIPLAGVSRGTTGTGTEPALLLTDDEKQLRALQKRLTRRPSSGTVYSLISYVLRNGFWGSNVVSTVLIVHLGV